MLAGPSHQEQAISAWVLVTSECQKAGAGPESHHQEAIAARVAPFAKRGQARARADRELPAELGHADDHRAVVAGVSDQKDGVRGSQVALLRPELPLGRLHIVQARLGFDDGVEGGHIEHAIRTAAVAGERDRDFGPPSDPDGKASGEPPQQRDMAGIADRCRRWMDRQAELVTDGCGQPREHRDIDMGRRTSLDPDDLGVGDPDPASDLSTTQAERHPGGMEVLTQTAKKRPSTIRASLCGRDACWHG